MPYLKSLIMILIVIFIFLMIYWIYNNKLAIKSEEGFSDISKLIIKFLDISESQTIINKYHLDYFKKMKLMEIKARNIETININNNNQTEIIQDFYFKHILNFTSKEKTDIKKLIRITLMESDYLEYLFKYFQEWHLIKVDNLFEDGLPHTIHDCIVIPISLIKETQSLLSSNKFKQAIKYIGITLCHEQVHVWQKKYPQIFDKLYLDYWNFVFVPSRIIDPLIRYHEGDKQRLNPDGLSNNYLFKITNNKFLIVLVLLKEHNLAGVNKYGLILDNGHQLVSKNKLQKYSDYLTFFGNINNNYHPNELSASFISEYIMLSKFLNNKEVSKCQAFRNLKRWIQRL